MQCALSHGRATSLWNSANFIQEGRGAPSAERNAHREGGVSVVRADALSAEPQCPKRPCSPPTSVSQNPSTASIALRALSPFDFNLLRISANSSCTSALSRFPPPCRSARIVRLKTPIQCERSHHVAGSSLLRHAAFASIDHLRIRRSSESLMTGHHEFTQYKTNS